MWSYHAERLVAGAPPAVRSVIAALVDELWGDRCRLVLDDGHQRIDAIAADAGAVSAPSRRRSATCDRVVGVRRTLRCP